MEIERILFTDGNWIEIKKVLTRGMRKQIDMAAQKSIPYADAIRSGINVDNPDELKAFIVGHPELLASSAVDDAMLLVGITSYSYGNEVTLAQLDEIAAEHMDKVLDRMRELYIAKREQQADFFGKPSQPMSRG